MNNEEVANIQIIKGLKQRTKIEKEIIERIDIIYCLDLTFSKLYKQFNYFVNEYNLEDSIQDFNTFLNEKEAKNTSDNKAKKKDKLIEDNIESSLFELSEEIDSCDNNKNEKSSDNLSLIIYNISELLNSYKYVLKNSDLKVYNDLIDMNNVNVYINKLKEENNKYPDFQKELKMLINISEDINKIFNKNINKKEQYSTNIDDIIDFFNEYTGSRIKKIENNKRFILNRLKEGFTYEDAKNVIIKKTNEWKNTEMEKYIRIQTLFGTKFDTYLNEKTNEVKPIADVSFDDEAKKFISIIHNGEKIFDTIENLKKRGLYK